MPARHHQPRHRSSQKGALRPPRKPSRKPAAATEEHPQPQTGERLQKVLAQAGVASRRDCEELVREGRVEVDHHVVTELGTRVDPLKQEIRVDGEALARPKLTYFAVNKPVGVVSTARDPAGRHRVTDLLPPNSPRVYCVGRLDMASEGLILVTNDGELANGLTHPRHGVEKIYHVQVAGQVEREVLAQLHKGIHLAEGFAHVKHVRIKSRKKQSTILEMVLDEGRNREVRRLLARVGHKVQRLKRIAVGPVRLGDLPTGAVRFLDKKEIESLHRAVAEGPNRRSHREADPKPHRAPDSQKKKSHRDHREHRGKRTIIG
jgi:23S rRNA pseudouridine2605 synthase